MTHIIKPKRKQPKPLKEDIFGHLESMYRSARRTKNPVLALKIVETCIKAKNAFRKQSNSLLSIYEMPDEELEKIVTMLQEKR